MIQLLLDRGANISASSWENLSLLSWATMCGHEAIVRLLLDPGEYQYLWPAELGTIIMGCYSRARGYHTVTARPRR